MNVKHKKIVISCYDESWPRKFKDESNRIKQFLGNCCLDIHHIGSTSIQNLSAKENIDILCVIDSLKNAYILEKNNYIFKGEYNIPFRYFYSKHSTELKVNLHIVERGHAFIDINLCFRDYLRKNTDARNEYQDLKYKLLEDPESFEKINGSFSRYNLGKDEFIKSILRRDNYNGIIVNFVIHQSEWRRYEEIMKLSVEDRKNDYRYCILYKGADIIAAGDLNLFIVKGDLEYKKYLKNFMIRYLNTNHYNLASDIFIK